MTTPTKSEIAAYFFGKNLEDITLDDLRRWSSQLSQLDAPFLIADDRDGHRHTMSIPDVAWRKYVAYFIARGFPGSLLSSRSRRSHGSARSRTTHGHGPLGL